MDDFKWAAERALRNFNFDTETYKTGEEYQEILCLDQMLTDHGIEHKLEKLFDGWHIVYPPGERVLSAIQHCFSYGSDKNLIEIMGLLTEEEKKQDEVLGFLSTEEVFARIKKHHDYTNVGGYR